MSARATGGAVIGLTAGIATVVFLGEHKHALAAAVATAGKQHAHTTATQIEMAAFGFAFVAVWIIAVLVCALLHVGGPKNRPVRRGYQQDPNTGRVTRKESRRRVATIGRR